MTELTHFDHSVPQLIVRTDPYRADQGRTLTTYPVDTASIGALAPIITLNDDSPARPTMEGPVSATVEPATAAPTTPAVALGSMPLAPEESQVVYHSMAGAQLMSWPVTSHHHVMDPATCRRLMTPLHVVTSLGCDFISPSSSYLSGAFAAGAGGGLLKIATTTATTTTTTSKKAQPVVGTTAAKDPLTASAEARRERYVPDFGLPHAHSTQALPGTIAQRSAGFPTLAVAPITSGERISPKRPSLNETPCNDADWPQLTKTRKLRTTFSKDQIDGMESSFQTSMYLTVATRKQLAQKLGLEDAKVKTWFQNRRMRYKREHPGVHVTPTRKPTTSTCRSARQLQAAAMPLHCPPAALPCQFLAPTPPPSVSAPSFVPLRTHDEHTTRLPPAYPLLPPSPVYNFGMAPSAGLPDGCSQAVFGPPVYPHLAAGFGVHPTWISTNAIGPHGGGHVPPRHI